MTRNPYDALSEAPYTVFEDSFERFQWNVEKYFNVIPWDWEHVKNRVEKLTKVSPKNADNLSHDCEAKKL